jgi:hypothetical protein
MDGNFLVTGACEVMLSKGLGQYVAHDEKRRLFQDAKMIADLLAVVMERGTQEVEKGIQRNLPPIEYPSSPRQIKKGLEKLGKAKHRQAKLQWLAAGIPLWPGLRQLRPEDLPLDVTASSGYDHRGLCYVVDHKKFGELGRIVLIKVSEQKCGCKPISM